MTEKKSHWIRYRFKKNKVWLATDDHETPLEKNGRFLIKYQLDQPHEYWVKPGNITPLEERSDSKGEASSAPPDGSSPGTIVIYTDGAASGNPGPAGIGAVLIYGERQKEISRFIGTATNNIAELEAIRVALKTIRRKDLPVRIYTDSAYAKGVLTSGWKAKKNIPLITSIRKLMRDYRDLEILKVPGHAGNEGNEKADALATSAVKRGK